MKNPSNQKVRAAGILLMHAAGGDWEFLLLRHPTRWDLPKGHCDPDESFQQAALRETEEETGIASDKIRLDENFAFDISYPVTYRSRGDQVFEKQIRYFLGYVSDKPALQLTEHQDARWFPWNPPHCIQVETIDPLLVAVAKHLDGNDPALACKSAGL